MTRPADNSVIRYWSDQRERASRHGSTLWRPQWLPSWTAQYGYHLVTPQDSDWLDKLLESAPETSSFFCDANVVTNPMLNARLGARLMLIEEVEAEVDKFIQSKPKEARECLGDLLDSEGRLNKAVRRFERAPASDIAVAVMHYVSLLHLRRSAIGAALEAFAEQHGRSPTPTEKREIKESLPSLRTRRMSKVVAADAFADDALPVLGIVHALLSDSDTFIVSADNDVFDQFYKVTGMLRDDYAAARGGLVVGALRSSSCRRRDPC